MLLDLLVAASTICPVWLPALVPSVRGQGRQDQGSDSESGPASCREGFMVRPTPVCTAMSLFPDSTPWPLGGWRVIIFAMSHIEFYLVTPLYHCK